MSPVGDSSRGLANDFVNGSVSFWYRAAGWPESRAALPGSVDADVCIVGAGIAGLSEWDGGVTGCAGSRSASCRSPCGSSRRTPKACRSPRQARRR